MDRVPFMREGGHAGEDAGARAGPRELTRLLLYGRLLTRQRLATRLLAEGSLETWHLLAATVRSSEPWQLRARCLEVLGLMAGGADQQSAERVLDLLLQPPDTPAPAGPLDAAP